MARFQGELVEEEASPKTPRFGGEPVADEVPTEKDKTPPKEDKNLIDRAVSIAKETGVGGVVGFAAPELLTALGTAAYAFPATAPAGPFLMGTGAALRGQRAASTAMGALGGALGETSGQVAEIAGASPAEAELARFVAGTFGPELPRQLGTVSGTLIGRAAGALGVPGMGRATTIGQLLAKEGVEPGSLTREQREFIERKVREVRGGASSTKAQEEIAQMLRSGASRVMKDADTAVAALERQANEEIARAQASAGQLTADAQKRVSALQSQLETSADKLRVAAEGRAQEILNAAQQRSQEVLAGAANQSPRVREIAQAEADQFLSQGRAQADQVLRESAQRVEKLRRVRSNLLQSARTRVTAATPQVGQAQTRTELGDRIRTGFTSVLDRLKAQRSEAAELNKQAAFGEAFQKEAAGQSVTQTKAAQDAVQQLDVTLRNPVTGAANVPEGTIRNQIQAIRDVLSGKRIVESPDGIAFEQAIRPSFEQLEIIRRSLRDRASGLPAEGYDAISQGLARELADSVEKVQREFSPSFGTFLENYRELSKPINKFASDLGKAVTGRAEYDFAEFAADPAGLADKLFASKRGVDQLVSTVGPEAAEQTARAYVASRIGQGSAKEIDAVVRDPKVQDWLGTFPRLKADLEAAAARRTTAESVASKRSTLAKSLRTEIGKAPEDAAKAARRREEDAAKAAERRLAAGEREAGKLTTEAEREAARIASKAETSAAGEVSGTEAQISQSARQVAGEAEKLRAEAERAGKETVAGATTRAGELGKEAQKVRDQALETAKLLTAGDKIGTARVRDLIVSENEREIGEAAKVILGQPKGAEVFSEAVGQVIADIAVKSPKNAIERWKYSGEAMVKAGLIEPRRYQELADKLQELMVTPVNAKERMTLVRSLFRNALVGYAAPGVSRAIEGAIGEDNAVD